MTRLLLVEDDQGLGYILKEYLELNNYTVDWVLDGEKAWKIFQSNTFDLCLLDVMLPSKDGFQLAKDIRSIDQQTPIVFLTSKALKIDKLKGFKIGADDYIVKPVDEEELIARIEAITRRVKHQADTKEVKLFTIGQYQFDFENQKLYFEDQQRQITSKEAEILRLLCLHEGHILDRKITLKKIWGESDYFKRRSMDVFISRLRKYLDQDPAIQITNVHGRGYILTTR